MCTPEEAKFVIFKLIVTSSVAFHRITFCRDEEDVKLEKSKIIDNPTVLNKGTFIVLPVIETFGM